MEDFNNGERDMITFTLEMEQSISEMLKRGLTGEIPSSEGKFVLVKVGSEEHHNMKVEHALIVPAPGTTEFLVCTKIQN